MDCPADYLRCLTFFFFLTIDKTKPASRGTKARPSCEGVAADRRRRDRERPPPPDRYYYLRDVSDDNDDNNNDVI